MCFTASGECVAKLSEGGDIAAREALEMIEENDREVLVQRCNVIQPPKPISIENIILLLYIHVLPIHAYPPELLHSRHLLLEYEALAWCDERRPISNRSA